MPDEIRDQLVAAAPVSRAALIGGGIIAAAYIFRNTPSLSGEDRRNLAKSAFGVLGFVLLLSLSCSIGGWSFCTEVPQWPK